MFNEKEISEIKDFINKTSMDTKIYIGTDSTKIKKKKVRYATVVIVHQDGMKGCKIFGSFSFDKDIDYKPNRPFNRMMQETYKTAEIYLELANIIGKRYHEVHLDINPDKTHGSSVAVQAATGYIQGVCQMKAIVKPAGDSFAASVVADKWLKK